jgi:hypothetical protein
LAGEYMVAAVGSPVFPRHEVPQRRVVTLCQALFATGITAEVPGG